jgi:hypothetical protein
MVLRGHAGQHSPLTAEGPVGGSVACWRRRTHASPVIALNKAVAVSMADGPAAGLVLVEQIEHDRSRS